MSIYRIAIVGAGPAGYFSAQALQSLSTYETTFKVDLFERLPTPWGLVRSGVAPDHPKIKSVAKVFEQISDDVNFRLFANVEVGRDISLESLQSAYDAVILAVGTPVGKRLGIPGEELLNCWSPAEFVPWYNGHPDYSDLDVDLSGKRAVVIGAGNVAMDVARLLVINPKDLATTDISDRALEKLKHSSITEVRLCARRGPEFASFTAPEFRELQNLKDTSIVISEEEICEAITRSSPSLHRHAKANLDVMQTFARMKNGKKYKSLEFHFGFIPKKINGTKKVESVLFDTSQGEIEIEADIVITAIGYEPDLTWNLEVDGNHFQNVDGFVQGNLYVVGWAKHGPTGVIGSNKGDSMKVIQELKKRISSARPKVVDSDVSSYIKSRIVSLREWRNLNAQEIARGTPRGRPRVKFLTRKDLLKASRFE